TYLLDLSFFPTPTGIAIGQRRNTRGVGFPELFPLDLKNTVITFDSSEPTPEIAKSLIEDGAEYFLKITEKQGEILRETQDIFNDPLLVNQTKGIEEYQESLSLTRSLTVAPAKLLKTTSLSQ
ncbi:MAG: hypothetical protein LUC43_01950, partial [Burkholderiales bacterium]|nr:hypothetical protein [Burkholderiales bacterium]